MVITVYSMACSPRLQQSSPSQAVFAAFWVANLWAGGEKQGWNYSGYLYSSQVYCRGKDLSGGAALGCVEAPFWPQRLRVELSFGTEAQEWVVAAGSECPRRVCKAEQPLCGLFSLLQRGMCASPAQSWQAEVCAGTPSTEQGSKKSKNLSFWLFAHLQAALR